MLVYEVVADLSPDLGPEEGARLAEAYVRYQTERHIPAVLASGCFLDASFERRFLDTRFRVLYRAESPERLDEYLRDHAPALRDDFARHFPTGLVLSRAVWTVERRWDAAPPG